MFPRVGTRAGCLAGGHDFQRLLRSGHVCHFLFLLLTHWRETMLQHPLSYLLRRKTGGEHGNMRLPVIGQAALVPSLRRFRRRQQGDALFLPRSHLASSSGNGASRKTRQFPGVSHQESAGRVALDGAAAESQDEPFLVVQFQDRPAVPARENPLRHKREKYPRRRGCWDASITSSRSRKFQPRTSARSAPTVDLPAPMKPVRISREGPGFVSVSSGCLHLLAHAISGL